MKKLLGTPAEYKLPFEDIVLTTKDGVQVHAWLIRHKQNSMTFPTVLYLHGNGGSILCSYSDIVVP